MKPILLIPSLFLFTFILFNPGSTSGQELVAVNDTITAYLYDDTLTVDVLANDYDPQGQNFSIVEIYSFSSVQVIDSSQGIFKLYLPFQHDPEKFLSACSYKIKSADGRFAHAGVKIEIKISNTLDTLKVNSVSALVNNANSLFWNLEDRGHFEVPAGSGRNSFFAFNLWLSGTDGNEEYLRGDFYRAQPDFWTGPYSDPSGYVNPFDSVWNRLWKIDRSEIVFHQNNWWKSGYVPPEAILSWPGNGDTTKGQSFILAPFKDLDQDNIYEPMQGDYPLIRGDQSIFFILNDTRYDSIYVLDHSMGIELHGWVYAFDCDLSYALDHAVFIHYDVYNRSERTYMDSYLGAFADPQIGNWMDDYLRTDVMRNSFFVYNGDSVDDHGQYSDDSVYGNYPPGIGTTMLAGPYKDADGMDNPSVDPSGNPLCNESLNGLHFGDSIVDNERLGMSYLMEFPSFYYWPNPTEVYDIYDMMRGYWNDTVPLLYAGDGNRLFNDTGEIARFIYPGLSDPCNYGTFGIQPAGFVTGAGGSGISWTEESVGNLPFDRRAIISSGPVTFNPSDKQELDFVLLWSRQFDDPDPQAILPLLRSGIDEVKDYFVNDITPCGSSFSGIAEIPEPLDIMLYPNPALHSINLEYPGSHRNYDFRIFDLLGKEVMRGELNKAGFDNIGISQLEVGMYILMIEDRFSQSSIRFIKSR